MLIQDQEAEQIVLGSLLQDSQIFDEISNILRPDDFYHSSHGLIYQSISDEIDKGSQPDILLVVSNLKEKNILEKIGSQNYLAQIASLGSSISASTYAKKVKDLSLRRSLLNGIKEVEKSISDPTVKLEELLSRMESAVFSISDRYSEYRVRHIKDIAEEFSEYLEKVKSSQGGITGTATYYKDLDQVTTGLKEGQLLILAARPGVGKTTLALNIAQNIALKSNLPVLIFSLEMTSVELLLRMVCADAFLESSRIQKGYISQREMDKVYESTSKIYSSQLYLDDSSVLSGWELKQRARRLASNLKNQNKKLSLIIVDYLQLMTEGGRVESRQVEVASISRSLKAIAKELAVPVLAVSQMNRGIEQRGRDHRPQLSDLRESGAIEQDADIVMFIHREEIYNKDLPEGEKGFAELIIAKHRAGPTGNVKLAFLKEKNLFINADIFEEDRGTPHPQPPV